MPRTKRALVFAITCATLGLVPLATREARAQGKETAAEALFVEGKRLMGAGNYAEACPKIAESQRIDPGPGTLLTLATCYDRSGKTASAWTTYKDALGVIDPVKRKEWAARAKERVAALEPSLSKL